MAQEYPDKSRRPDPPPLPPHVHAYEQRVGTTPGGRAIYKCKCGAEEVGLRKGWVNEPRTRA